MMDGDTSPPDDEMTGPATSVGARLVHIELDANSIRHATRQARHEAEVAIYDLLDGNSFRLVDKPDGPYRLTVGMVDDKLVFHVLSETETPLATHYLALTPFRRVIRDYFTVCETYYEAIKTAPPSRIQAVDMGRRALHDEGSTILKERLTGKIEVDHDTARRLFTLICALRWRG